MNLLAYRNLLHDKIRLAVTLTGIVMALVLVMLETGLFVGFTGAVSCLIDHSQADLWVTARRIPYFDIGLFLNERKVYQVKSAPGVVDTEKFILHWSRWNRLDSRQQEVQIVGFNADGGMGGPWSMAEGRAQNVKTPDGVIVDESYKKLLGITAMGQVFEINGHRARVIGFTHGIRAFATAPHVFCSVQSALDYTPLAPDQTTYVLVKTVPGANLEEVRKAILERVEDVDVLTTTEFSRRTRIYWTFTTGAGIALLSAAALGLIVGFVVAAQTMYATTMDHLKEFGTLKAMGASNSYVCGVILLQAIMGALIGYGIGMLLSAFAVRFAQLAGATIPITWWIVVMTFFMNLFMCAGAALISINKVMRLDPAMVFKGLGCATGEVMKNAITIRGVTRTYAEGPVEVVALRGVDLDVDVGEMVMLAGPSGSGKTTLLSVMGCILRPTSGSVRIAGEEVTHLRESDLPRVRRRHISFIFQGFNLFATLTAGENVELMLGLKGVHGKQARKCAHDLLERVGLEDKFDTLPANLSGGQRQRVAIARAFAGKSSIILADEPTAALDSQAGRNVMELMRDLAHNRGRAAVVVTHDPRVLEFADRVILIEDGVIRPQKNPVADCGVAGAARPPAWPAKSLFDRRHNPANAVVMETFS